MHPTLGGPGTTSLPGVGQRSLRQLFDEILWRPLSAVVLVRIVAIDSRVVCKSISLIDRIAPTPRCVHAPAVPGQMFDLALETPNGLAPLPSAHLFSWHAARTN